MHSEINNHKNLAMLQINKRKADTVPTNITKKRIIYIILPPLINCSIVNMTIQSRL